MEKSKIAWCVLVAIVLAAALIQAVTWSPQGNVDLKKRYNMTNLSFFENFSMIGNINLNNYNITSGNWIFAVYFNASGNVTAAYFIGNGSQLTSVTAAIWAGLTAPMEAWNWTYNATYALWAYNQTTATFEKYSGVWNSTYNATYDAKISDNTTWNQSLANTLYSLITEPLWTGNSTLVVYSGDANKTKVYCGNITGATSNLCTLIDSNCSTAGSCSNIAYINYANTGNFNISGNFTGNEYRNSSGSIEWIKPEHIFDVDDADIETDLNTYVDIAGDTMSGALNMSANNVTDVDCIIFTSGGKICTGT